MVPPQTEPRVETRNKCLRATLWSYFKGKNYYPRRAVDDSPIATKLRALAIFLAVVACISLEYLIDVG